MSGTKNTSLDSDSSNSSSRISLRSSKRSLKDRSFDDGTKSDKTTSNKPTKQPKKNPPKPAEVALCEMELTLEQKIDKILTSTSQTNDSIKELQEDVTAIKASLSINDAKIKKIEVETVALKNEIAALSTANNKLQQQSLSKDIVIFGLQPIQQNQMSDLVAALSAATKLPITINDFAHIYITTQRSQQKSTVHAKFYSQQHKDTFMRLLRDRKKNNNPLLYEDIMRPAPDDPKRGTEIIVRSKLTTSNRDIIREARNHKSRIKFTWERDGRILIRQTDTSPIIEVLSMNQLMKLLNPSSSDDHQNINNT